MKKRLFIICIALLLSVTATFSWILSNSREPAKLVQYDLGVPLPIASSEAYSLELYRFGENGEEIRADSAGVTLDGLLPGDGLRFRLKLTNGSGNAGTVRLTMGDIVCEADTAENAARLLDYLYLAVVPSEGYTGSGSIAGETPAWVFTKLSDLIAAPAGSSGTVTSGAMVGARSAVIYEALHVPRTFYGQSVNLDCRLWLDTRAADLENIRFEIGSFLLRA